MLIAHVSHVESASHRVDHDSLPAAHCTRLRASTGERLGLQSSIGMKDAALLTAPILLPLRTSPPADGDGRGGSFHKFSHPFGSRSTGGAMPQRMGTRSDRILPMDLVLPGMLDLGELLLVCAPFR